MKSVTKPLFFNIETLQAETKGDPFYMIIGLYYFYIKRTVPLSAYQKYKPIKKSLHGASFMLNPAQFFSDKVSDILDKVQYLKLCALRDYGQFKLYDIRSLDLKHYPDINLQSIKHNKLLYINNSKLHFIYEENNGFRF